nr:hypothetical protein [uncultured Novosphingobium sp.]
MFDRTDEVIRSGISFGARRGIAVVILPAFLLAGCGANTLRYAGVPQQVIEVGNREAAVVTFECTIINETPAIVGALVGIGVDAAVSLVSGALARAKEARTASWTASEAVDLGACTNNQTMTVTRGVFDGATGTFATVKGKTVYPAFVLKANVTTKIEGSGDAAARIVTITPTELIYSDTAARDRGSKRKEVTVSIGFSDVDAKSKDDKSAAATVLNLGKLQVGRKYTAFNLTGAIKIPVSNMNTTTVVVTESEDADVALAALADAFKANQNDLETALKDAINKALQDSKE